MNNVFSDKYKIVIYPFFNKYPASDGLPVVLEGFNNTTRKMERQAYGFSDRKSFKFRIYALHKWRYAFRR